MMKPILLATIGGALMMFAMIIPLTAICHCQCNNLTF